MNETLLRRIEQCEDVGRVQQLSLDEQIRGGLEGVHIGIIRLIDDQTLAIEVADGCISRDGEKIADIPNLDVLKTAEALIAHINATTSYQVTALEI